MTNFSTYFNEFYVWEKICKFYNGYEHMEQLWLVMKPDVLHLYPVTAVLLCTGIAVHCS